MRILNDSPVPTTFGFLVGQVMKAAGGQANPKRVNELLKKALGAG